MVQKFTDTDYYLTHPYFAPSGADLEFNKGKTDQKQCRETDRIRAAGRFEKLSGRRGFHQVIRPKILETGKGEIWFIDRILTFIN